MTNIKPLALNQLYHSCDISQFNFKDTSELENLTEIIGQARATEALQFGIKIKHEGYHLFVHGPAGMGKHNFVKQYLEQETTHQNTPDDWCYVNNFEQPHKPNALKLPSGSGYQLKQDMSRLVEELHNAIPAAFDSDEYHARVKEKEDSYEEKRDKAYAEFAEEGKAHDIEIIRTPSGYVLSPIVDGKALSPSEFRKLPQDQRERIGQVVEVLEEQLTNLVRQEPKWQREFRDEVRLLNQEIATLAVGHLIEELKAKYSDVEEVDDYLDQVQEDVVSNVGLFLVPEDSASLVPQDPTESQTNRRYQVNLMIDHRNTSGAPIVYEDIPTYQNIIGRVEHLSHMGTLVTDFMLIKPGALHSANGGYLMLDANKLLVQPFAWEALKRTLDSGEIKIQSLGELYSLISTASLEPEPIPLDIKVVLFGDRFLFYLLNAYDPEFGELFKVAADFDESIDRSPDNNVLYARLIATIVEKNNLLDFDTEAVARIIEHGSRLAEDSQKLTTHIRSLADLLIESDHWCREDKQKVVTKTHVQRTIDAQIRRADRLREKAYEHIERGTTMINVDGEVIGQINALSVIDLGHFAFAQPTRITATAHMGEGGVIDIHREVDLGGPIHSKGVFILSAFLASRFAINKPMSVKASVTFEQSYGMIEGDSASVAELCALLSVFAQIPISQSIAITGSVNQHGEVQAIGGVNEKIEGFFDVCKKIGLNGKQGVIIPSTNIMHLMLRKEVVDAVESNDFQIYSIDHVDQAIELLTGLPAGECDAEGNYPEDSFNNRVDENLEKFAQQKLEYSSAKQTTE